MNHSLSKKIKAMLNNPEQDIQIKKLFTQYSFDEILSQIKIDAIGINAYPNSQNKKADTFLILLQNHVSTANEIVNLNNLCSDITILNLLFEDFYSLNDLVEVKNIPDEYKLFGFLISFELYIRSLKDIRFNQAQNKSFYGEVDIQRNVNGEIKGVLELSANQFAEILDYLLQEAKSIIQALIYHNYLYEDNFKSCSTKTELDWDFINESSRHIKLIDLRTVLFEILEEWKYDYIKFHKDKVKNNSINIEMTNKEDTLNYFVERERYENSRQIYTTKIKKENFTENRQSSILPPEEYINSLEYESYHECIDYFKTEHLHYEIKDVSLVKWIRAYSVIRAYNAEFRNENTFPDSSIPQDWLYVSTKENWINIFVQHGIDKNSAEIIFENLRFTKTSKDLFDNPFIILEDKIITVPSIISEIHIVSALISMSTNHQLNLEFKGYTFEDHLIKDLEKNNIDVIKVTRNYQNQEYQCDAAFVIGRDLFICECKNNIQPRTLNYRHRFYEERIPTDIAQLKRIGNFYSLNMNHIIDEMNSKYQNKYSLNWHPRKVYNLLIYNSKIARQLNYPEAIVTDYSIFSACINKRYLTMFASGDSAISFKPPAKKGVLNGALTTNKLLNFLKTPWQIDYSKYFSSFSTQKIPLNKYQIHRTRIFREMDHFYELKNPKRFNELISTQNRKNKVKK